MPTDDQLRAFYSQMNDAQLADQKARLGKVTAEAHVAQDAEEAMAEAFGADPGP